jgi:hypothetical protein
VIECFTHDFGGTTTEGEFGIHFDRLGQVDYRRSDLDDDNVLDGGKLTDATGFD